MYPCPSSSWLNSAVRADFTVRREIEDETSASGQTADSNPSTDFLANTKSQSSFSDECVVNAVQCGATRQWSLTGKRRNDRESKHRGQTYKFSPKTRSINEPKMRSGWNADAGSSCSLHVAYQRLCTTAARKTGGST